MAIDYAVFAKDIKRWGRELGFAQVGIAAGELVQAEIHLNRWLAAGFHGQMHYMARHGNKRARPAELVPGTQRIICVRMDYLPEPMARAQHISSDPAQAFISRYALGRDYHKVLRGRLKQLVARMEQQIGCFSHRLFVDSAPVMEKPLAEQAGLGWIGKHSNLLSREAGSWFFLGEIYVDQPLPVDSSSRKHCGTCQACIESCPTAAIVAPYVLDARRCIAYLTVELAGSIPEDLRPLLGNRIFGCDDCQRVCPWNRRATLTTETDFQPRHGLDCATLVELFAWDEDTFRQRTQGTAIHRLGHERWLRNISVALGNAAPSAAIHAALSSRLTHPSPLVREHVAWALTRLRGR